VDANRTRLLGQELLRVCLALMRRSAMSLTASRVLLPLFMLTLAATPAAVIGRYAGHAIRARKGAMVSNALRRWAASNAFIVTLVVAAASVGMPQATALTRDSKHA
jgi:hypothetical protein